MFKKNLQKIKFLIIVIVVFLLGIFAEKSKIDDKISQFLEERIDKIYQSFYSAFQEKKIYIYIEPRHYENILEVRDLALKNTMLTKELEDWVPARISLENNAKKFKIKIWFDNLYRNLFGKDGKDELLKDITNWIPPEIISDKNAPNIMIRLKGVWPEHWTDETQWSFKIKFIEGKNSILDLERMALQPPKTLDYLYEWVLSKALEKEKLIYLPVSFSEVIINNQSRGVYTIQGQISDEILLNINRPLGPIIGFTKDTWIEEQINSRKLYDLGATDSLNGLEDTFWRTKIEPVRFRSSKINTNQEIYLKKSIYLLESFRKRELKTSEVFDIDKLAKVMALKALLGSTEFDPLDTKFYYNPDNGLLEPITKEAHVNLDMNWKENYYSWWIDSSKIRPHYTNNTNFFIDLLYSDNIFYEKYLNQLKVYSSNDYFNDLINANKEEFDNNMRMLKNNYPTKKIFSFEQLDTTKIRVRDLLSPVQGLNVYFKNNENNKVKLSIHNIQRLPIEILGLELENQEKIYSEKPILIAGKKPLNSSKETEVRLGCKDDIKCNKSNIGKQKLLFRILGQDIEKKALISPYYTGNN